jgi:hypothetical protein
MTPSDERFLPSIKALMRDLAAHIKEEETGSASARSRAIAREEQKLCQVVFSHQDVCPLALASQCTEQTAIQNCSGLVDSAH